MYNVAQTRTYESAETLLRAALQRLVELSDLQQTKDGIGLSKVDQRSAFLESCGSRIQPLTGGQLNALYNCMVKYQKQLAGQGLALPAQEVVREIAAKRIAAQNGTAPQMPAKNGQPATPSTQASIDIHLGMIFLAIANGRDFRMQKDRFDQFRAIIETAEYGNAWVKYDGVTHLWRMPLSEKIFLLLISNKFFSTSFTKLMPEAQRYKAAIDEREIAALQKEEAYSAAQEHDYQMRLHAIGGLDAEFFPGKRLYAHQKQALEVLLRRDRFIVADETGLGKAATLNSKLLTPTGWVRMGDIALGDKVIGQDGRATTVTGVFPQGKKSIYRVTMNDGSTTECCDEHLWTVNTPVRKHRGNPAMTVQLKDIMYDLHDAAGKAKYHIPLVQPVQFEEQSLPLNPYALGLLLGNGSLSVDGTVHFTSSDSETVVRLSDTLPSGMQVRYVNRYDYAVTSPEAKRSLPAILRELGLSGHKSITKFIPVQYQFASVESRIALLQGLLDTDSYVGNDKAVGETPAKKGSNIEYSTSSEQLAKDVIALVQSLGGVAYVTSRIPHYTHKGERREGQRNYRVNIALPAEIVPFRLERRKNVYQPRTKYQPTRAIAKVEYVGEKEAQCIRVDASDHLYVADDYIVTHNTLEAALPSKAKQLVHGYRVYIVTTKSSTGMWRKICLELGISAEIFGWGELLTMPLLEEDYPFPYVLIVDEGHYACNMESKRTKKYYQFASLKNCKGLYTLTGTPMPNGRPINQYPLLLATHHPLVWDESPYQIKKKKSSYLKRFCGAQERYVGGGKTILDVNGATNLAVLNALTMYVPGKRNNPAACILARLKMECTDLPPKERFMDVVDLTPEATAVYKETVERAWQEYNERVEQKLADYALELREKGYTGEDFDEAYRERKEGIERAQALVSCGILRHAGAVAKIDTVVERAGVILDRGGKLVIFSSFLDVVKTLRQRIERECGVAVGLIEGDTKAADRDAIVDDFQSNQGVLRVVLSTAAGGEAITLTGTPEKPCQFMMIVDRPYTPGKVKQWEDRIHRMTTTGTVTIYWMQMPAEISPADEKVDAIIQRKQINIDMAQFGKVSAGVEFTTDDELSQSALSILKETYDRVHGRRKRTKK